MEPTNRLTLAYLGAHPEEAARTLENLPGTIVAPLLDAVETGLAVGVLARMLPDRAAQCLVAMDPRGAAAALARMTAGGAARIVQNMSADGARAVLDGLGLKDRMGIRSALSYPPESVGAIMDARPYALAEDLTVGDALRRIRRERAAAGCAVFIVDGAHRLRGTVDVAVLLRAERHLRLRALAQRRVPSLRARAGAGAVLAHPGWLAYRELPVVDGDGSLVGALRYQTLRREQADARAPPANGDAFGRLLDLARLYWVALAALLGMFRTLPNDR